MARQKAGKVGENKSEIVRGVPMACADESAAVEFMERRRWGDTPCCPRCGDTDVYQMKNRKTGQREAGYRWRCRGCGKQYSVRTGTVLEESRIPVRHWCYALWAACASKKGVSAKQIQRQTGVSYKSALFMMHRIRWAMTRSDDGPKLSGTVEVDETYVGGKPRYKGWTAGGPKARKKWSDKTRVVGMVERGGSVRAEVSQGVTVKNLAACVREHVDRSSRLMTDENRAYNRVGPEYASHEKVTHSRGEYARGDVTTNTVEGFFSLIKRGIYGTYHAVSKKHLHRYITEFEFRYNHRAIDDGARLEALIRSGEGKRLTYRQPI
ncbi:MAG: IS1595 family transposase [Phycisphaerales bacterium JB037]